MTAGNKKKLKTSTPFKRQRCVPCVSMNFFCTDRIHCPSTEEQTTPKKYGEVDFFKYVIKEEHLEIRDTQTHTFG